MKHETEYALQLVARSQRRNLDPDIIAPFAREALSPLLTNIQWFDLTTRPLEERVVELICSWKTRKLE